MPVDSKVGRRHWGWLILLVTFWKLQHFNLVSKIFQKLFKPLPCHKSIGKMLHAICISAVAVSLRWASCGPWASCFFYLQVALNVCTKFPVNGPFDSKEVHNRSHGSHLGFLIERILAIFDPQVALILSNESVGLSIKKFKIHFDDGGYPGFAIGTILVFFSSTSRPNTSTKFRVNWTFCSGEEVNKLFSRWQPQWPSWISDLIYFSYVWSTSHLDPSSEVLSQLAFQFRRSSK